MLDGGTDPRYFARHIVRMAWEDIRLVDPCVFQIVNDAAATLERLDSSEGEFALMQAVLYLVIVAKSSADYKAYNQVRRLAKENASDEVPVHLCNAPTKLMKELGHGRKYRYAHDEPSTRAAGESYMPDGSDESDSCQPVLRGLETKIDGKLA